MFLDGLVSYLVQIAMQLLYGIVYLPYALIKVGLYSLWLMWTEFAGLISSFYALFASIFSALIGALTLFLPSAMLVFFGLILVIVFAMRIYSIVKDVSIFGWKL